MSWFSDFKAKAMGELAKFNNANFKNAAMAACALISAADGSVSSEEKNKVAKIIMSSDLLKDFNPGELGELFKSYCEKAGDEISRLDLLGHIRKLKGNETQADYALKVALIIANADGNFDGNEKKVVGELCTVLGVPAADYL